MKIAIAGTRGIPARYGGFETFAEELGVRLVKRGHEVTVYSRRSFGESPAREEYLGVRLVTLPTFRHKYFDTPVHSLFSFIHSLKENFDVILLCNAANSPFAWIARLKGCPIAVNVDGIERRRAKWSSVGKFWYWLGEHCSVLLASKVVADAEVIADYYRRTHRIDPAVIAYGAEAKPLEPGTALERYRLKAGGYLLYVSRLEPENNALGVVRSYREVETDMPLVVVGDAPYAKSYIELVKESADKRVIFTGFQFGDVYRELRSNCYLYIQATEVGGTHPALVEAMAYGNCVVANKVPEHEEVLGDDGIYYERNDFEDLSRTLNALVRDPEQAQLYGERARRRVSERYSWERIVDQYEALFIALTAKRSKKTNLAG